MRCPEISGSLEGDALMALTSILRGLVASLDGGLIVTVDRFRAVTASSPTGCPSGSRQRARRRAAVSRRGRCHTDQRVTPIGARLTSICFSREEHSL
jgi:hypothetical protein